MPRQTNNTKTGRAWKMERAGVNKQNRSRSKTNKFSGGDTSPRPAPGSRQRVWVGGYTRADGTKVAGYYRDIGNGQTPTRQKSRKGSK
jgi:hypothetical protein